MSPSTPTAGPTPLGQLLSESFAYYKAHFAALAVGAVVFGVLTGLVGIYAAGKVQHSVTTMMGGMGMDMQKMEELSARMEAGDDTAAQELQALIANSAGTMDPEAAGLQAMSGIKSMLPFVGLAGLVSLLVSFVAHAYFALVAVEGKDVNGTLSRAGAVVLPLAGVSLWAFIRSFVWIPFLGWIVAIVIAPRFVASPLIFLAEGKGVMGSVSSSYARTRGYWAKIVGNVIVAALIMFVIAIVIDLVAAIVLSSVMPAMIVFKQIVSQFMMAFMCVFMVRLSHTILQNPRA